MNLFDFFKNVDIKETDTPPKETPPDQKPPEQKPPAQTPPTQTPPAQTPPAQTPPDQNTTVVQQSNEELLSRITELEKTNAALLKGTTIEKPPTVEECIYNIYKISKGEQLDGE